MHFTEAQLAELRRAGARLDATDMEMADRLGHKGLVGAEFVAAYRESNAMRAKHPELAPVGRDLVETVAISRKLGLGEEERYWFVQNRHQRHQTLTRPRNVEAPSGRGMVTFGSVTTGLGICLLAVGMPMSTDLSYDSEKYQTVTSGWGYLGKTMEILGGVGIVAGLSITVIGLHRWTTPVADDVPDSPRASQGPSLRRSASAHGSPAIRWALVPALGPQQARLGLAATF
ncbi:MAG: hypothetical protein JXP73_11855 [Deltaproteobacteria bacterium]|nr:hypothetical protein [Deltaproteobacteria bacterium]